MPKKEQTVTSLKINPELWKEAKIQAIKHNMTLANLVEEALKEKIEKLKEEEHSSS